MGTELRLRRFRVQNYKSIEDSGWIDSHALVTPLLGKNEAGKSALLKALYKLNPIDGEPFVPVREFPRGRYTYDFGKRDWEVISADFSIPSAIQDEIDEATQAGWRPERVTITKHYSGNRSFSFSPQFPGSRLTGKVLDEVLAGAQKKIRRATSKDPVEELQALKERMDSYITAWQQRVQTFDTLHTDQARALINEISSLLGQQLINEWQRPILEPIMDEIDGLKECVGRQEPLQEASDIIQRHLPVFIYFEDYGTLDDTLVIDRFIADYNANRHDPKLRTKMALFQHINLKPEEVLQLGLEQPNEPEATIRDRKDERTIKLASASRAMTEKFHGWYGQREHTFEYRIDASYFRIWVSDNKNPDPIELANRSRGLQWFFSFYLVFLVEAEEGHRNAILLLDEPGLHLHPTAQQELIEFFENLAQHNQLLYTTHSPFMIDGDHLDRVRVVSETAEGRTEVSDRIWPRDRDATFPLQAALGYSLAQTLFQSKRSLVVEGLTDLWILRAIATALAKLGRPSLLSDIAITPAGGAKEIAHFASLFLGNEVDVVTLFDSDSAGRRYAEDLKKKLFEGDANRIIFIRAADGTTGIELEDLIPRSEYLAAVAAAHQELLGTGEAIQLSSREAGESRVTAALEAYVKRTRLVAPDGGRTVFDKGATTRQLLESWEKQSPKKLDTKMLDNFECLFRTINEAFANTRSLPE